MKVRRLGSFLFLILGKRNYVSLMIFKEKKMPARILPKELLPKKEYYRENAYKNITEN